MRNAPNRNLVAWPSQGIKEHDASSWGLQRYASKQATSVNRTQDPLFTKQLLYQLS